MFQLLAETVDRTVLKMRYVEFEVVENVGIVESCTVVFTRGHFLHLFRHFCYRMYHLATMHSVTERRTDTQTTFDASSRSYIACSTIGPKTDKT